jgi:putative membrane protein
MIIRSLQGLPAFLGYFTAAIGLSILYLIVYCRVTRHDEYDLVVNQHNASAALALGMSLIGFVIPLSSAILHSVNIIDCVIWGVVALLVQIAAYFLARLAYPELSKAIGQNALAAALWLGFISIAAGILSAASMSY